MPAKSESCKTGGQDKKGKACDFTGRGVDCSCSALSEDDGGDSTEEDRDVVRGRACGGVNANEVDKSARKQRVRGVIVSKETSSPKMQSEREQ